MLRLRIDAFRPPLTQLGAGFTQRRYGFLQALAHGLID
jgi:hypothetical protein